MPSKIAAVSISVESLVASFAEHLRAGNLRPRTIETYGEGLAKLIVFLREKGMPTDVDAIRREHLEAFIVDQLARWKPATAANRFRSVQQFFRWCVLEGEIRASPMVNMRPPRVPTPETPLLADAEVRALLKACAGPDFESRRDYAILLVLVDTGMRRAELTGILLADVDTTSAVLRVTGKGGRVRGCPYGRKTGVALDRYLRLRRGHRLAHLPALWLGRTTPLTANGIYQMLRERAKQAGVAHVHPHQFRHGFAHAWSLAGGNDTDLMRLAGWTSRTMLSRYGSSAADERAREAHKRLSPADKY